MITAEHRLRLAALPVDDVLDLLAEAQDAIRALMKVVLVTGERRQDPPPTGPSFFDHASEAVTALAQAKTVLAKLEQP